MKSNKSKSAMTALVVAAMICTAVMPVKATDSQWVNSNGNWSYVKADGSKTTGWIKDGECWYAFDENGSMRTGWVASHEHWYFMGKSGVMQVNTLVEDNGATYFVKSTGVMAKDYVKDGYEFTYDGKAIPLSESKSVILTDASELEGKVIEGNLYVDITTAKEIELKGVTVKGKLVIIGDNEAKGKVILIDSTIDTINTQSRNSEVVLSGKTDVKNIVMEETAKVTTDKNFKGSKVENFEIQSTAKGEVIVEVPTENVSTNSYASVDIQASVENLEVKTETEVKVNADVKNVTVTKTAKDTKVDIAKGKKIETFTADAPVKIEGEGTVEIVEANVDGVEASKDTTIKEVETGKDVTKAPDANKPSTGGGSAGGSGGSTGGGTDTKPTINKLLVSKINYEDNAIGIPAGAIKNQKKITLTTYYNDINVRSNDVLDEYALPDDVNQEGSKWIGFIVDTGEDSILGLTVNTGSNWHKFTQADIDEAASVGAKSGEFVFWMKAEDQERTIKVRNEKKETETYATIKYSCLVELAENAKKEFELKYNEISEDGISMLDWDTVITAANYYDELKQAAITDPSINGKLAELTNYYAGIEILDLYGKKTSQFEIKTSYLKMFTGLKNLNLGNTGITELDGLKDMKNLERLSVFRNNLVADENYDCLAAIANLTNLKRLYINWNLNIKDISSLANLSNLEYLVISGTSITNFDLFWNSDSKSARFPDLRYLQAKYIKTLTSIAGLVEVANEEGFSIERKSWDLTDSILVSDENNHIDMIKSVLGEKFKRPLLEGEEKEKPIVDLDFKIDKNSNNGEHEITIKNVDEVQELLGVAEYKITANTNKESITKTYTIGNDSSNLISVTLEDLFADYTTSCEVYDLSIEILNLNDKVIAEGIVELMLEVVVSKETGTFTVTKNDIDNESKYNIQSDLFKAIDKESVTVFYECSCHTDENNYSEYFRISDWNNDVRVKDNEITIDVLPQHDNIKFSISIVSDAVTLEESDYLYTVNIKRLLQYDN